MRKDALSIGSLGGWSDMTYSGSDDRIKKILNNIPPESDVLHLGAAHHTPDSVDREDWLHRHLASIARELVGVDIAEAGVKKLRDLGYQIHLADVQDFELGRKFNVVVAGELIEHVERAGALLRCIRSHLGPDGILIITTPNPWSILNVAQALWRDVHVHPEHVAWYDSTTLRQLVERMGFEVDSISYTRTPRFAKGWVLSSMLTRIGLKRIGGASIVLVGHPSMQIPASEPDQARVRLDLGQRAGTT